MAYTLEQKAVAIAVVRRHDGLVTTEAIDEIRRLLTLPNLTTQTVRNWLKDVQVNPDADAQNFAQILPKKKSAPVTESHVEAANEALDEMYERAARKYLTHALKDDVVADTKGPQAIVAAATATDKMRLLRNLPTEIVGILPGLIDKLNRAGYDALDVFTRMDRALDGNSNPTFIN